MNHTGTVLLETDRLILRPFTLEDAPAMYRNWCSDPEVTRIMTWPTPESVDITRMIAAQWVAGYQDPKYYQWAIVLKELGEPVGSISGVHLDENIRSMEIGYCIGKRWWHQGITSEALNTVLAHLFDRCGFNRIEARHDVENPHSGGVMAKCGMIYEGTSRQSALGKAGLIDVCGYAILKQDWERQKCTT